ncbi:MULTISPECIES: hypothetical protein [unclassified Arthrobacter]|uniref:hypothetical protein n=1 Tax=unclassified Arthrobacter TaxID=235627 RepID=UPI001F1924EC|nr:hypothetical protein [Arthrobacter sp. FW305-BF8]UKA54478.1 hypothetical protein LFT45_00500 [Arthrobacter sp. FW305-BF8]
MDESFDDYIDDAENMAARHAAQWQNLCEGEQVQVREGGRLPEQGIVDALMPDGGIVWIRLNGQAERRMYLAGDPVELLTTAGTPPAF